MCSKILILDDINIKNLKKQERISIDSEQKLILKLTWYGVLANVIRKMTSYVEAFQINIVETIIHICIQLVPGKHNQGTNSTAVNAWFFNRWATQI